MSGPSWRGPHCTRVDDRRAGHHPGAPGVPPCGRSEIDWLPLIAFGIWTAAAAYRQWAANERAIRAGTPIPRSHLAAAVTGVVVVVTTLALLLAAISGPPT
jgi:uncharacterized membrane protein YidH (DUF202 family)